MGLMHPSQEMRMAIDFRACHVLHAASVFGGLAVVLGGTFLRVVSGLRWLACQVPDSHCSGASGVHCGVAAPASRTPLADRRSSGGFGSPCVAGHVGAWRVASWHPALVRVWRRGAKHFSSGDGARQLDVISPLLRSCSGGGVFHLQAGVTKSLQEWTKVMP